VTAVILSTSVAVGESVKGRTSMARLIPQMMFLFAVASMTVASRAGTAQKSSLPSYTLKVSKDGKDYNVDVSANIRDGSETFHLNEASSGRDAGDIIYDLKRVIIMITLCVRGVSYSRPWSERGGRDELDSASPTVLVETEILISAKSEILIVIEN